MKFIEICLCIAILYWQSDTLHRLSSVSSDFYGNLVFMLQKNILNKMCKRR